MNVIAEEFMAVSQVHNCTNNLSYNGLSGHAVAYSVVYVRRCAPSRTGKESVKSSQNFSSLMALMMSPFASEIASRNSVASFSVG
jgi:hypothetical protein